MDIYLKELANANNSFRFPSLPEELDVKHETQYQEYNLIRTGKRSYPIGKSDETVKWSGYFWGKHTQKSKSVNIADAWLAPTTCITKLKNWQTKKTPLNLTVSGGGINIDVTIESFSYKAYGGHGDFAYDIVLRTYYPLTIMTTKELNIAAAKSTTKTSTAKTTTTATKKKTHKVKKGDTLAKISKKYYKVTTKWKQIYTKNKTVIENAAKKKGYKNSNNGKRLIVGITLTIP